MPAKKTTTNTGKKVGAVVATVVGVAATAAAAYMLFGPEGKKNRQKIKGWAVKMKGEVIEKMENMKEVTEPMFDKAVDQVSAKYAKMKGVSEAEVKAVVSELKKYWKHAVKDHGKKATPKKKTTVKK